AVIRNSSCSPDFTVISALPAPILNRLSLSATTSITRDWANAGSARATRIDATHELRITNQSELRRHICIRSARHVTQNEARVLIGEGSADSHMADDGPHHARRKLRRRCMAASAVGTKPLFALQAGAVVL